MGSPAGVTLPEVVKATRGSRAAQSEDRICEIDGPVQFQASADSEFASSPRTPVEVHKPEHEISGKRTARAVAKDVHAYLAASAEEAASRRGAWTMERIWPSSGFAQRAVAHRRPSLVARAACFAALHRAFGQGATAHRLGIG